MEIVQLKERYNQAKIRLATTQSNEEKIFLVDYIKSLYEAIENMREASDLENDALRDFNTYILYSRKASAYFRKTISQFFSQKDFHRDYLGGVFHSIEEDYHSLLGIKVSEEKYLFSEKDFWDIVYLFFKEYDLEDFFDSLYKNQQIHSMKMGEEAGLTLHNILTGDTDLFIHDFHYDVFGLQVLAHEVGHAYDDYLFSKDAGKFNDYLYLSHYTEAMSFLFERLLIHFLANNHIHEEELKKEMVQFKNISYDTLGGAYVWSLVDNFYLDPRNEIELSEIILKAEAKRNSEDFKDLDIIVRNMTKMDLPLTYSYAYGEILSMFLCEEVEKNGLSNDLVNSFLQERYYIFSEKFIQEKNFSADRYAKLYQKELQLIKK